MQRKRKAAVRRRLFMLGLVILLAAVCIVMIPFSRFRVSAGETNDAACYMTYVVHTGDTLWDLADTYRNHTFSTHEAYINEVMRANGLESCHIYDGQLLLIPCEADPGRTASSMETISGK